MEIKNKLLACAVVVVLSSYGFGPLSPQWQKLISPPSDSKISTVYRDHDRIVIGADNGIYVQESSQMKAVAFGASGLSRINDLAISKDGSTIYVASDEGAFIFDRRTSRWSRIFSSSDEKEKQCRALLVGEYIVLGTGAGIYYRNIQDANWQKMSGDLARSPIEALTYQGKNIYAATPHEVYRYSMQTQSYKKIFHLAPSADEINEELEISVIKSLRAIGGIVFIGSENGVFISADEGDTWQQLPLASVPVADMTSILPVARKNSGSGSCVSGVEECYELFIATHQGAFLYAQGRVTPLYQGMETNVINDLSLGLNGEVLAATNTGLYALRYEEALPNFVKAVDLEKLQSGFRAEPTIKDVHLMAINYADVDHRKIASWKKLAKLKAAMPSVSAGVNRSATDRYHWDTGQSPDILQEGKEYLDWDVSLSWDLGDLVWSTDQTTIDSRSKLMVELREDILDQVTRLYFERRRLQVEMMSDVGGIHPPLEKQLRLDELTALIDGYTGGGFSQAMMNELKGDGSDGNARN